MNTEKAFLTEQQLAHRWGVNPLTLRGWRHRGRGPAFVKFGRCVRYALSDIERFEHSNLHRTTAAKVEDPGGDAGAA